MGYRVEGVRGESVRLSGGGVSRAERTGWRPRLGQFPQTDTAALTLLGRMAGKSHPPRSLKGTEVTSPQFPTVSRGSHCSRPPSLLSSAALDTPVSREVHLLLGTKTPGDKEQLSQAAGREQHLRPSVAVESCAFPTALTTCRLIGAFGPRVSNTSFDVVGLTCVIVSRPRRLFDSPFPPSSVSAERFVWFYLLC